MSNSGSTASLATPTTLATTRIHHPEPLPALDTSFPIFFHYPSPFGQSQKRLNLEHMAEDATDFDYIEQIRAKAPAMFLYFAEKTFEIAVSRDRYFLQFSEGNNAPVTRLA
ncbi:hypothetical protein EYR41_010668 [Orbilia oligospora]|uniref:Uncharacterized protein n=1 Tax=Orbilia oligospora TaxID=2813651 RepID=A0A8H2HP96_ORBOL|nr:hypothetical protein TWF217_005033 [Orbilia oligospora]TGJ64622.1 hypothetical protein EYR41_010668 [Orbilia oligospora]